MRDVLGRMIQDHPSQVMLGTDWPMCNIQGHLDLVDSLGLNQLTRNQVLGGNAAAVFELPV